MRFEEAYSGWTERRLTQEDAARLLGVCARTFRRYIDRYEDEGLDGLLDKRLTQVSHRRAPVDEVLRLVDRYRRRHDGWSVKHYYAWYRREGGTRSYSWVKEHVAGRRRGEEGGPARGAPENAVNRHPGRGCCCTRTAAPMSGYRANSGI